MERLEIKKVYIDTRFKTADSKGDTDFAIELPKTFNLPEDVVCYINDIAIPVSWATVSSRNDKLYFRVIYDGFDHFHVATLDQKNYNGASFAAEVQKQMNWVLGSIQFENDTDKIVFNVTYNAVDNMMVIEFQDIRTVRFTNMKVIMYSDTDVIAGLFRGIPIRAPQSIADNIRLTTTFSMETFHITKNTPAIPYECYLNLHPIRNLYLHSSALSSYDTVTNFGMETIVKKIPVRANYNEMIFDATSDGFDFIFVSKRTLNRIDFQLTDAYGNLIDLRNNHFSFSLVFQRTN